MCDEAIDAIGALLETTTDAWLHNSLPVVAGPLSLSFMPLSTILLGLIRRDRCPYSIAFAHWPGPKQPFSLENIDGEDIELEPAWDTIAIPSTGDGVWVVKEFVEFPQDVNELVKVSVTGAKLDTLNEVGAKTLAVVQAMEPHVKGVPTLVKKADETQREAVERIERFRQHNLHNDRERAVWDGLTGKKMGKDIAAAQGCSPATITLTKKAIEKRCKELEIPIPWRGRDGRPPGYTAHASARDADTPTAPVNSDSVSALPIDWRKDLEDKKDLLDAYDKASDTNKEAYRTTYPDIENESADRRRRKGEIES